MLGTKLDQKTQDSSPMRMRWFIIVESQTFIRTFLTSLNSSLGTKADMPSMNNTGGNVKIDLRKVLNKIEM